MKFSLFLMAALFGLVAVGGAQQELVEQKAKSGESFGEKALKAKAAGKTVGGGYRYGTKKPPTELKQSPKQVVLKEPPAPGKSGDPKKKADGRPLTTGDVVTGVGLVVAFPLLILMGLGAGEDIRKEAAREQMFGGKP